MAFTLEELKERLSYLDEMSLLEVLNITSTELVNLLEDHIELNFERLEQEVSEEEFTNLED